MLNWKPFRNFICHLNWEPEIVRSNFRFQIYPENENRTVRFQIIRNCFSQFKITVTSDILELLRLISGFRWLEKAAIFFRNLWRLRQGVDGHKRSFHIEGRGGVTASLLWTAGFRWYKLTKLRSAPTGLIIILHKRESQHDFETSNRHSQVPRSYPIRFSIF